MTGSVLLGLCAAACAAQTTSSMEGGPAVQIVVTAEPQKGKDVPPVSQSDLRITSGKNAVEVVDWVPAQGDRGQAQVLLLMDDSSNSNLGTQFPDLKRFISQLPPQVQIGIGYMRDGTVYFAQDFTLDHAAAAAKLRLPMGAPGADTSPYFSLTDLFKKWHATTPRREILMISDGVDRFGGLGPDNPYVNDAITQAQRAGVIVSSIYWRGVGHLGHSSFRINWGQNYLAQMADATGGESYWQGFGDPVAFAPYLDDFTERLQHQYLLTLHPAPRNKDGLEPLKIRTEIPHLDLVGPTAMWVSAR